MGMPLVDGSGAGLYEVRTSVDGNIYRAPGLRKVVGLS